jgi:hypothetical protein
VDILAAAERRIWVAAERRISAVVCRIWAAERHTSAAERLISPVHLIWVAHHISAAVARISVRLISEAVIRAACRTSQDMQLRISRAARHNSPVTPDAVPDQLSMRTALQPGGSLMSIMVSP